MQKSTMALWERLVERRVAMLALAILVLFPTALNGQAAKQPIHVYAYVKGDSSASYVRHTLLFQGDGDSGTVRYVAASFDNGARFSLDRSGTGSFSIQGGRVTIKAGELQDTGTFTRKERIVMDPLAS